MAGRDSAQSPARPNEQESTRVLRSTRRRRQSKGRANFPAPIGSNQEKTIAQLPIKNADTDDNESNPNVRPATPKDDKVARSLLCNDCGKRFRSQAHAELHASKTEHIHFAEDENSAEDGGDEYLFTERARYPDSLEDDLMRVIVKLHEPVCLKTLALLRTGITQNMIDQTLVEQLKLVPTPTTRTVEESLDGYGYKIYGEHVLEVTVADHDGDVRTFKLSFLAAYIKEDMIFGTQWMKEAGTVLDLRQGVFYWNGNQ